MQISVINAGGESGSVEVPSGASCGDALKLGLSGKQLRAALAARVASAGGERLCDLSAPLPGDARSVAPVTADDPDGLALLRHSVSHIMAAAVQRLFPHARVTIGPSIDSGSYYDFDVERPFTVEDLPAIEEEMRRIAAEDVPFVRSEMKKADAVKLFESRGENYKAEIIGGIDADTVSLYRCGEFLDLCRGPHLPRTGLAKAFKLLSVAGAYWRGDEKNTMLSRIYGTAVGDEKALKAHLERLAEARRRDHRKLGRELDLFCFHEDVAPGMSFWLPRGMLLRTILEDFLRREHLKRGYEIVQGPQILRRELWEKSGHYDHYRANMYFTEIEGDVHGVKPMNCVGHMLIYNQHLHSYRELPMRLFELGVVHRHEKSGTLHGLLRVRQFTQDDAHLFVRPDQLLEEFERVIDIVLYIFKTLKFDNYTAQISLRDPNNKEKYIGSDENWEKAESAIMQAAREKGLTTVVELGEAAFYGPKLDFMVKDAIGRKWQLGTIQVDYNLPERFDLTYKGADDKLHRPIMIHRAPFGSMERFVAVLLEHTGGKFPLWLSPQQVVVLPISEKFNDYAQKVAEYLNRNDVRTEVDDRNEKIGRKIRDNELKRVPYLLIVGEKEEAEGLVSVRAQGEGDKGQMTMEAFRDLITGLVKEEIDANKLEKK